MSDYWRTARGLHDQEQEHKYEQEQQQNNNKKHEHEQQQQQKQQLQLLQLQKQRKLRLQLRLKGRPTLRIALISMAIMHQSSLLSFNTIIHGAKRTKFNLGFDGSRIYVALLSECSN